MRIRLGYGHRAAILMSAHDYDGLLETLDILSDAAEVRAIQEGIAAIERGETYSADEVRQAMAERSAS